MNATKLDIELFREFMEELDIPKYIIEMIFCAVLLILMGAAAIKRCLKYRERMIEDADSGIYEPNSVVMDTAL